MAQFVNLALVGISHQDSDMVVRESMAWSAETQAYVMTCLKQQAWFVEGVVLVTCYRTEIQAVVTDTVSFYQWWSDCLCQTSKQRPNLGYQLAGQEAFDAMLMTCAGLHSKIIGETQIQGQYKMAYEASVNSGASKRLNQYLYQQLWYACKKLRNSNGFRGCSNSLSKTVMTQLKEKLDDCSQLHCVVLGAGAVIQDLLPGLKARFNQITCVSRQPKKLSNQSMFTGVDCVGFDQLSECMKHADAVISATGAKHCLLGLEHIKQRKKSSCLIDLSMPRNIDPRLADLPGVTLINIDAITQTMANKDRQLKTMVMDAKRHLEVLSMPCYQRWLDYVKVDVNEVSDFRKALDAMVLSLEADLADSFACMSSPTWSDWALMHYTQSMSGFLTDWSSRLRFDVDVHLYQCHGQLSSIQPQLQQLVQRATGDDLLVQTKRLLSRGLLASMHQLTCLLKQEGVLKSISAKSAEAKNTAIEGVSSN